MNLFLQLAIIGFSIGFSIALCEVSYRVVLKTIKKIINEL